MSKTVFFTSTISICIAVFILAAYLGANIAISLSCGFLASSAFNIAATAYNVSRR